MSIKKWIMNKTMKKYGIWDVVTLQGLSKYPNDEWNATFEDGGFYLFDSKKDAIFAAHELTKMIRQHPSDDAEIEWHIVEVKEVIRKTMDIRTAKVIKD